MRRQTFLIIGILGITGVVAAEDAGAPMGDLLFAPHFQFQQYDSQHQVRARLNQYNATLSYPLRTDGINIGVGMNLRMIEGDIKGPMDNIQSVNTTVPMLHARASFDLPLQGMSASVSGNHMDYEQWRAYDYRASLSYQFDKTLGMQGGWQHQQFNLDAGTDSRSQFENKGPFVDFFWRF